MNIFALPGFGMGFREALEVCLIITAILAYLNGRGLTKYNYVVWLGLAAGVVAGFGLWFYLPQFLYSLPPRLAKFVQGCTMLLACFLITGLVTFLWRKGVSRTIGEQVNATLSAEKLFGLFSMVFWAVFREGTEVILFAHASDVTFDTNQTTYGAIVGIFTCGATFLVFHLAVKTEKAEIFYDRFFNVTKIAAVLLSGYIASFAAHDFQGVGIIPAQIPDSIVRWLGAISYLAISFSFIWWRTRRPASTQIPAAAVQTIK